MANVTPVAALGKSKRVHREPMSFAAAQQATSIAAGGAATVAFTGVIDKGIAIDFIDFGYRVASPTGSIQISDGTLTWGPFQVVVAGLQTRSFNPPLLFGKSANVTITLSDGNQLKDLFAQAFVEGATVF